MDTNFYKVLFVLEMMSVMIKRSPSWHPATMNKRMLKSVINNNDVVYLRSVHLSYGSNPRCLELGLSCETCTGICSCDATLERRSVLLHRPSDVSGDYFSSERSPLRAAEFDSEGRLNIHSINLSDFPPFMQDFPLQDGKDSTRYFFFYDIKKENYRTSEYYLFVLPGIRNIIRARKMLDEGRDAVKSGYVNDYVKEDLNLSVTNDVFNSEDDVRRTIQRIGKERILTFV